jgi:hypothetical protein
MCGLAFHVVNVTLALMNSIIAASPSDLAGDVHMTGGFTCYAA